LASPGIHLPALFAQVRRKIMELNGLSSPPGNLRHAAKRAAGSRPRKGAWARVAALLGAAEAAAFSGEPAEWPSVRQHLEELAARHDRS
jgi:hypothetical protein